MWKRRTEALLLSLGLRNVVFHPVAKGSLSDRAASKGRPILTVKDVEKETVELFLEMEEEEEEKDQDLIIGWVETG